MAFFDFLKPTKNKLQQAIYQYWVSNGIANIMPDDFDSYMEQGYSTNADVYSIIQRIDAMRKQAPLKLYKYNADGEKEEVTNHELSKFAEKVNKHTTTDDYISQFLIYRLILGNIFSYYPKYQTGINKGKTAEIHVMPSTDVEILMGDWMNPVSGYKLENSIKPKFEVTEVYHSKMFDPAWNDKKSMYGMSPLRAAARIVSKQNESEITQLKQFQNQGAPYVMFRKGSSQPQMRMTETQQSDIIKQVKKASNSDNRGLPLVLKDEYGILNLGQTIADLNILESSKAGLITLCNIYGMPPDLFGAGERTYNNVREAKKAAWTQCLQPNLKEVSNALNEMTINNYEQYVNEGLYWAFDYSQVEELQQEMKDKVVWMNQAKWTPNEIRQATGLKPIDNELMDQPIFAMGDVFLSDMGGIDGDKNFEDYEGSDPKA